MPVLLVVPTTNDPTLTVSGVVNKVRIILQDLDAENYRTPDSEIIGWLNDALNAVLSVLPGLFIKQAAHSCVAGARQEVGFDRAVALADVVGVPQCEQKALTEFAPGWMSGAQGAAKNWMRDPSSQKVFRVYPPSTAGQSLPVDYVESPAPLFNLTDVIPVPESFEAALVDYCAGMTQLKEDESISFERQQLLINNFKARISA